MAGVEHAVRPVSRLRQAADAVRTRTRNAVRACAARPRLSLAVWGVVIVLLAVGVGALWWQDRQQSDAETAREAALAVASEQARAILSYRHDSVDDDLSAAQTGLTGSFKDDFGRLAREVIARAAKQGEITTSAKVVSSAVVSATPTEVVALLFVTQTTTSEALAEPRIDGSRLRVALTLVDDWWLVSDLKPI